MNSVRKIQDKLTEKSNKQMIKRKQDEDDGNYSKLERNVVKLQQKVSKQSGNQKSSTSGVMS